MAFIDKKIVTGDYTGKDVAGLPDKPSESGISAATLKARFDSLTKNLTVENFNALIDELIATTSAGQLGGATFDGITGTTIQALLENLKIYTDGEFSTRDTALSANLSGIDTSLTTLGNSISALAEVVSLLSLLDLADTPSSYVGQGGKILSVKATEDGVDFTSTSAGIVPAEDVSAVDVGEYYTATRVEGILQEIGLALSSISLSFIGLTDTPATYTGQAGKFTKVNDTEDGLEFVEGYTKTEVDNKVKTDVPLGAVFTDTVFSGNASDVDITDSGAHFTSTNVEGALQEVGANKLDKPSLLTETTSLIDTDLIVVEDTADTKKITKANFKETMGIDDLETDVGDLQYTEQNVVTSGESITDSIDALDVAVADKAPQATTYTKTEIDEAIENQGSPILVVEDIPTDLTSYANGTIFALISNVLKLADNWEQGSLESADGTIKPSVDEARLRTVDFHNIEASRAYSLSWYTGTSADYEFIVMQYESDNTYLGTSGWQTSPYNFTSNSLVSKIKLIIKDSLSETLDPIEITPNLVETLKPKLRLS